MIHVLCNDSYFAWSQGPSLRYLFFPRCVSWFLPARGNSYPEHTISQYISSFRQHSPNHLIAALLYSYHKSTLCFLFNINAARITLRRYPLSSEAQLLESGYRYLLPGGLSGNRCIAYLKITTTIVLLNF